MQAPSHRRRAPPLLFAAAAASAAAAPSALEQALQQTLTSWAAKPCPKGDSCEVAGHVLQLSWKDASQEFTIAAGTYQMPETGARAATAQDTFIYGSGTKPFTAAGVMALVEQGVVGLDDPLARHVDPALAMMKPGTSLASLFGSASKDMTVRQSIGMRLGIDDYDGAYDGAFDDNLLMNASVNTLTHSPVEFLEATASLPMVCQPGTCCRYSSTSMILASLVIMTHQPGLTKWTDFDERYAYPAPVREQDLAKSAFYTDQMTNSLLTGPGYSSPYNTSAPKQLVWSQSGSIMGLGCANLVAPTSDVTRFFWDLLGPQPKVLNSTSVAAMIAPLETAGKGYKYGLGLSEGAVFGSYTHRPQRGEWGSWLGHVGDVYGFAALEGFFYGPNASMTIATNYDDGWSTPSDGYVMDVACNILQTYSTAVEGTNARSLGCKSAL